MNDQIISINPLSVDDAHDVYELAKEASYTTSKDHTSGFLYNPLTLEAYKERLSISKSSFKALINNKTYGYVLNLTSDEINKLEKLGAFHKKDKIINLIKSMAEEKRFIYIEQLVISKDGRKTGIGSALHSATINLAKKEGCSQAYSEIGHAPATNKASIAFVSSLGWKAIDEVENAGRTYGVYSLRL